MFCKKCGKELEDAVKFCDGCGEQQQAQSTPISAESVNAILEDGKNIIRKFFSKSPADAIITASSSHSKMGIVLVAINALLFALVSCFNTTQVINLTIKTASAAITSTTNSLLGGALGNAMTGQAIPDIKLPVLFELFAPFLLFALAVSAVIFAAIYILFKLKKQPSKSVYTIANVIGTSALPITAALAMNFVLGFILPQFTLFLLLAAVLTSLTALYEGIKGLFADDTAPLIEFAILAAMISIILAIASQIALAQVGAMVQDTIMKAAGDGVRGLGGLLGGLFG